MVAKFDYTPFDKMEEKESLLRATPFGDKENGSNGSSLASCDTDVGNGNCVSRHGDSFVEL